MEGGSSRTDVKIGNTVGCSDFEAVGVSCRTQPLLFLWKTVYVINFESFPTVCAVRLNVYLFVCLHSCSLKTIASNQYFQTENFKQNNHVFVHDKIGHYSIKLRSYKLRRV